MSRESRRGCISWVPPRPTMAITRVCVDRSAIRAPSSSLPGSTRTPPTMNDAADRERPEHGQPQRGTDEPRRRQFDGGADVSKPNRVPPPRQAHGRKPAAPPGHPGVRWISSIARRGVRVARCRFRCCMSSCVNTDTATALVDGAASRVDGKVASPKVARVAQFVGDPHRQGVGTVHDGVADHGSRLRNHGVTSSAKPTGGAVVSSAA